MPKVFWRGHDGKNSGKIPSNLLKLIGEKSVIDSQGNLSWKNFGLNELMSAVSGSIAIEDEDGNLLNETNSNKIISSSLFETIKKIGAGKPILAKQLFSRIQFNSNSFFAIPKISRKYVTSVSISNSNLFPISANNLVIEATNRKHFPYPKSLTKFDSFLTNHIKNTRYQCIVIVTNECSAEIAFEKSSETLSLVVGLWNFVAGYMSTVYTHYNYPISPSIGSINIAPVFTLHNMDNSLCDDIYWFEPSYCEDKSLYRPESGWEKFEKDRKKFLELIEKSTMRKDLVKLFSNYSDALNTSSIDGAFMKLWNILERITNTVGGNYDLTIERAVWSFEDREIAKELLHYIRMCRNRLVHASAQTYDQQQLCTSLKAFVDNHLLLLMLNHFEINALEEYGQILSIPRDKQTLERKRDWYNKVLKWQE